MILNDKEIRKLVAENNFVTNYVDLEAQLTPNGFDLTAEKIFAFSSRGQIGFDNSERVLPQTEQLQWTDNAINLTTGCYKVTTNESIKMPLNLIAIAMPRSSLLRSGVTVNTGVWDAGFQGKSEFLLIVQNHEGFVVRKNARLVQLVFIRTNPVEVGYEGIYKSTT